jgi:DNA-binding transcriptional ArsR family regulator
MRTLAKVLGLNKYESMAYSALCSSKGFMKAGKLSKISKVPQSKIYGVLKTLEEKGLVKVGVFRPTPEEFKNLDFKTFKKIKDFCMMYGLRISFLPPSWRNKRYKRPIDENGRTLQHSKCYKALPLERYTKKKIARLKSEIRLLEECS